MTTRLVSSAGETVHSITLDTRIARCEMMGGLSAINRSDVPMVIWRRSLPRGFSDWIDRLEPSALPNLHILVRPMDLRRALFPLLVGGGMSDTEMCDLLLSDVEALVWTFSAIAESELIDVRFERITDDACWKFHRDSVDLRLLTTYRGATTQWVTSAYAAQALREQKEYSGPLKRLQPYDVAVFRGKNSDSQEGIVHRSPPIAGLGLVRWLLCLNKPTLVSPEPWSDRLQG